MSGSSDKDPVLTEEIVIIIACVCGVIIITLLVILFCFIFRRRRNAAKNYQGGNQGDPPPYNAVASHTANSTGAPANKKPAGSGSGYDNQDNNRMDSYPNRDGPGIQHSGSKDKYIDLTERGGGVDPSLNESGYNTGGGGSDPNAVPMTGGGGGGGGGKPKKVIYEVVV